MTPPASKTNPGKPQPTCNHCKKRGHYRNQCRQLRKERDQNTTSKESAGNGNHSNNIGGQTNSKAHNNKTATNGNANVANTLNDRKRRKVYPPCETCGKTNHSTEKCFFLVLMQATDRLFGIGDRYNKVEINNKTHVSLQFKVSRLWNNFYCKNVTFSLRNCM